VAQLRVIPEQVAEKFPRLISTQRIGQRAAQIAGGVFFPPFPEPSAGMDFDLQRLDELIVEGFGCQYGGADFTGQQGGLAGGVPDLAG